MLINDSPAVTDYEIVVDPNTKEPKLALKGSAGGIAGAVITVGVQGTATITCAIQLNDAAGAAMAIIGQVPFWLTSDAAGLTLEGTGPDSIASGTDGFIVVNGEDSVISGIAVSEADGDIDIALTKTTVDTMYLNIGLPNGKIVTSGAITFTSTT